MDDYDISMEPMDLVRDKFSQDCTIEKVLHLLMVHFELSEEEVQAEIDEYFEIVDMIDESRRKGRVNNEKNIKMDSLIF